MSVRTFRAQKGSLTRAVNSGDAGKVRAECKRAVGEWESGQGQFTHGWPDSWSNWQRALDDALGYRSTLRLEDL